MITPHEPPPDLGESGWSSTSRLPVSKNVSVSDVKEAEAYAEDYDRRVRALRSAQIHDARRARDAARRRFVEELGAEHAHALRWRLRELADEARRSLEPPRGWDRDFGEVHEQRRAAAIAFLGDRGVPEERLRHAVAGLRVPLPGQLLDVINVGRLIHYTDVPPDVIEPGPEPTDWTIMAPPYGGWQHATDGWSPGGFSWITGFDADPLSGLVRNEILLFDYDAGDVDHGQMVMDSQVAFWYTPPSTGLVEALIEAQCGVGLHELQLTDEWGWSDSSTTQTNYIMMHVLHGNVGGPSLAEMSRYHCESDDSESFQHEYLVRGETYWVHLFSDGPVPAQQPVVIRVGTRSADGSFTNDVSVRSNSTFRWFIRAVHLRTE
jgi:hypothetical protein